MWNEFRKFALKGNMVDLAVGVIVGAAIGKVVTSLVSDIVMPPIGLLLGRVNFSSLYVNLGRTKYATFEEAKTAGAPTINVGLFINTVIEFLIIMLVVFLIVRTVNRIRERMQPTPAAMPTTRLCPFCKTEIPIDAARCPHCTSDLT